MILRCCSLATLTNTSRASLAFLQLSSPLLYRAVVVEGPTQLELLFCDRRVSSACLCFSRFYLFPLVDIQDHLTYHPPSRVAPSSRRLFSPTLPSPPASTRISPSPRSRPSPTFPALDHRSNLSRIASTGANVGRPPATDSGSTTLTSRYDPSPPPNLCDFVASSRHCSRSFRRCPVSSLPPVQRADFLSLFACRLPPSLSQHPPLLLPQPLNLHLLRPRRHLVPPSLRLPRRLLPLLPTRLPRARRLLDPPRQARLPQRPPRRSPLLLGLATEGRRRKRSRGQAVRGGVRSDGKRGGRDVRGKRDASLSTRFSFRL